MNGEPVFVSVEEIRVIQAMQIEGFGGRSGLCDETMLQSALDRPINRWHYEGASIPHLASDYAFGIARNHPFVDGNKRAAFMAAYVFLGKNGYRFVASESQVVVTFLALAAGEMTAEDLAAWFEASSEPL